MNTEDELDDQRKILLKNSISSNENNKENECAE
jgi:hypothetical protein